MTHDLINLLWTRTNLLWPALISVIVSAGISFLFKRRETRYTAEVAYEFEQRKKVRELIGRYHGRLLNAAVSMSHRLWNLYTNHEKPWLEVTGHYADAEFYYFQSFVYRFLNVCALVRQLESEAVLLDARIAKDDDFTFLNYAAAIHWVMTDVALTDGLPYDNFDQTDHFFSDTFRSYTDYIIRDGVFLGFSEFSEQLKCNTATINPVLTYFDGLNPREPRLRWDRLVAFHLLLMAFINSFGYPRQYSNQEQFIEVAKKIKHIKVIENLVKWLPRHSLGNSLEARKIIRAANQIRGGMAAQPNPT